MRFKLNCLFLVASLQYFWTECASETPLDVPLDWWQTEVIYQIYPRSFKDSDGDGVGDLNGITEKVGYLKDLGVGAVWLSPIYKSPMADFGYDISDFKDIEPIFGTLEDFKKLKEAVKAHGLKLIMDFVPNHSSDEHEWFQKSVENIAPYSDYYVWKDAKYVNGTRVPPSNWLSYFEGSAWTWNEKRQKYYLHQYHYKQPDFDYRNPLVMKEMKKILRYWCDMGVDGFRVDTVFTLVEDEQLRDEPKSKLEGFEPTNINYLEHVYTKDQPETFDVVRQFRAILDEYSAEHNSSSPKFMATEAYSLLKDVMRYYGNETHPGAHFPFNFIIASDVDRQTDAKTYKGMIDAWYEHLPAGKWSNWVIGNHDRPRAATRFGLDMIDSIHIMQFMLPGTAVTYMGDENAMENPFIKWKETVDPPGLNSGPRLYSTFSRDPERAPFLWDDSVSAGFSTNRTTWLPVHPNYWETNLKKQMKDTRSHHNFYRKMLQLKKEPVIQRGEVRVQTPTEDILVIDRFHSKVPGVYYVGILNMASFYEEIDLTKFLLYPVKKLSVYASSRNSEYLENQIVDTSSIKLRPQAGIVLTTLQGKNL